MYKRFIYMCVCVSCACLVPRESTGSPWNRHTVDHLCHLLFLRTQYCILFCFQITICLIDHFNLTSSSTWRSFHSVLCFPLLLKLYFLKYAYEKKIQHQGGRI